MSCNLPALRLRSTSRSRSTYLAPLVHLMQRAGKRSGWPNVETGFMEIDIHHHADIQANGRSCDTYTVALVQWQRSLTFFPITRWIQELFNMVQSGVSEIIVTKDRIASGYNDFLYCRCREPFLHHWRFFDIDVVETKTTKTNCTNSLGKTRWLHKKGVAPHPWLQQCFYHYIGDSNFFRFYDLVTSSCKLASNDY